MMQLLYHACCCCCARRNAVGQSQALSQQRYGQSVGQSQGRSQGRSQGQMISFGRAGGRNRWARLRHRNNLDPLTRYSTYTVCSVNRIKIRTRRNANFWLQFRGRGNGGVGWHGSALLHGPRAPPADAGPPLEGRGRRRRLLVGRGRRRGPVRARASRNASFTAPNGMQRGPLGGPGKRKRMYIPLVGRTIQSFTPESGLASTPQSGRGGGGVQARSRRKKL